MNWRTALSGLCLWLLASCAAAQKSLPLDFSRTANCAVAAFVNEVAQMHFLAGIVTANEQMDVRVDSEALAHAIEDAIVADLRPTFGERVSPLKVPNRSDISQQLAHPPESSADAARRIGDASSKLVRLATDQGYSCLIVVIPTAISTGSYPSKMFGLGFLVTLDRANTYFSGFYRVASIPDNRPVAAGHLVTEPGGGFLTRRAVDVVWLPRVEPSTFVADFRTDKRLNERTIAVFKTQAPAVAPVIAKNVREALLPSQGQ